MDSPTRCQVPPSSAPTRCWEESRGECRGEPAAHEVVDRVARRAQLLQPYPCRRVAGGQANDERNGRLHPFPRGMYVTLYLG